MAEGILHTKSGPERHGDRSLSPQEPLRDRFTPSSDFARSFAVPPVLGPRRLTAAAPRRRPQFVPGPLRQCWRPSRPAGAAP